MSCNTSFIYDVQSRAIKQSLVLFNVVQYIIQHCCPMVFNGVQYILHQCCWKSCNTKLCYLKYTHCTFSNRILILGREKQIQCYTTTEQNRTIELNLLKNPLNGTSVYGYGSSYGLFFLKVTYYLYVYIAYSTRDF